MAQIIQKLNKLKNPESFIQLNTIQGFKYIDKAGEIVNRFHLNNTPPKFTMSLNGLVIEEPNKHLNTIKITPNVFWIKFTKIDSLDMIASLFSQEANSVLSILEVEKVSRIGWRNYFVYEFISEEKFNKYFEKINPIKHGRLPVITTEITTGHDFKANLTIQPVIKINPQKTKGVMFDIDVFKEGIIELGEVENILKSIREYLQGEKELLDIINSTFK